MPLVAILLLIVLVATFGFWDTVQGILGAIGILILLGLLLVGIAAVIGAMIFRRRRRPYGR